MFADSGDVDAFDFEEGTGGRSLDEGADLVSSCVACEQAPGWF